MRFYGMIVDITNPNSKYFNETGEIVTYKIFENKILFCVRFHDKLEIFYHDEIKINSDFLESYLNNEI